MKLHLDREAFTALLRIVGQHTKLRLDVLEKDYYITLFLKELSQLQNELPVYFKGGTALYKALQSIRRFSEDIDLTVNIDDCSSSKAKQRLKRATQGYVSLPRTTSKELESNQKGSITSVYDYESIMGTAVNDPLQRFGHVKVEATSFTVSEPFAPLFVTPLLYDKANDEQKEVLTKTYDVTPFFVETIRLERIFIDKIFACEFYYQRKEYFDVSKHIYDLAVMSGLNEIERLLSDSDALTKMAAYKRKEEKVRIGSNLANKPFSEFTFFRGLKNNKDIQKTFMSMQDIYVFDEHDKLSFFDVITTLEFIRENLSKELISTDI